MQGGAFRLPNGNTIMTFTDIGKISELDYEGNIVWEHIPTLHSNTSVTPWVARANKYSLDYLNGIVLGDINNDGILNILDIVLMINMILANDYSVISDVNEDGSLDILDVVLMVNILVNGLP